MSVDRCEADDSMRRDLQELGFDRPAPGLAWTAFRRFAARPLAGLATVTVGYFCEHVADRDDTLWLGFMRRLEEPPGTGWSCGCLLRTTVPRELTGVNDALWWWPEHGSLDAWRAAVEQRQALQKCLLVEIWRWAGFSE